jgi:hypothetical protein
VRVRVATILVGHERPVYLEALAKIDVFFEEKLPNSIRSTIIVDNSRPRCEFERIAPHSVIIGGDNSLREFSAWDRGLAYLDRTRQNPDLVHFATSAFDSLYTGYLDRFGAQLLDAARGARAVVGHIDYYDEPIEILGRESQEWIRSSFFFVPLEAVQMLRSVVSFERPEQLFTDDPSAPFRLDAPISKGLQGFIISWLTGEGTGQGVVWHSRFELSPETLPLFQAKTVAILNEHLFSLRLRELSYPIVDVGWLAGQLAEHPVEKIDWYRSWKVQVSERPE